MQIWLPFLSALVGGVFALGVVRICFTSSPCSVSLPSSVASPASTSSAKPCVTLRPLPARICNAARARTGTKRLVGLAGGDPGQVLQRFADALQVGVEPWQRHARTSAPGRRRSPTDSSNTGCKVVMSVIKQLAVMTVYSLSWRSSHWVTAIESASLR